MSYDLYLRFKRPPPVEVLGRYFGTRKHYTSDASGGVTYFNEDTGVYFSFWARAAWGFPLRRGVGELQFEINYNRPSYFALEADIELRALIEAFNPRILDAQMQGMGEGPYTTEGFQRGWGFGNAFATSRQFDDFSNYWPVSGDLLRATWEWNYRRRERMTRLGGRQFFPGIHFRQLDDMGVRTSCVWGHGMPTILPKVDVVAVGRHVDGEPRCCLVSWAEVMEVIASAGIDVTSNPVDIYYQTTPEPIAQWFAALQLFEDGDDRFGELIGPERLIDEETVAAAQRFATGEAGVATISVTVPADQPAPRPIRRWPGRPSFPRR